MPWTLPWTSCTFSIYLKCWYSLYIAPFLCILFVYLLCYNFFYIYLWFFNCIVGKGLKASISLSSLYPLYSAHVTNKIWFEELMQCNSRAVWPYLSPQLVKESLTHQCTHTITNISLSAPECIVTNVLIISRACREDRGRNTYCYLFKSRNQSESMI